MQEIWVEIELENGDIFRQYADKSYWKYSLKSEEK